ncbi:MAG: argininosuccinate lyase [Thermoanaerobaculia bacterium]|nr:argininosuccinate lyase [Thermoanaerobaculia bacterium]
MTSLWDKGEPFSETVRRFTVGRDPELDRILLPYDALASLAHGIMLAEIGILEREELPGLRTELRAVAEEAREGTFEIPPADEDGHTALENRLTERLGETGKRIHTGRSRNDQVIAALRLYGREAVLRLSGEVDAVVSSLLDLADAHREVTVPGYTHTRQGMPSTLGFLFAAHAEGLLDGLSWLARAFRHLDRSPLGSASGYGVALPLDRERVADLLAFSEVQVNTLAVQNDRGKTEMLVLSAVLGPVVDLSRLAGDLIWFSSDELGFLKLGAEVTTGSSIMPQKRNPDVLELVRARANRLRGLPGELAGYFAPLPSGYHRDLQLTKGPFLEGMETAVSLFRAVRVVLESLEVDRDRADELLTPGIDATDFVYARVREGRPFRDAYRRAALDPRSAAADTPGSGWRDRTHLGAPGALELAPYRRRLSEARTHREAREERIAEAWVLFHEGSPSDSA